GAEAATLRAEIAASLSHIEIGHRERSGFRCDVDKEHHVPVLTAFVLGRLCTDYDKIGSFSFFHLREFGNRHPQHRKSRMRAGVRIKLQTRDLRVADIFSRRSKRIRGGRITLKKLLAIDDLEGSAGAGAIAEVNAIVQTNQSVQGLRHSL